METDVLAVPRQRGDVDQVVRGDDAATVTSPGRRARLRQRVELAAYLAVVGMWGLYVLPAQGGWQPQVVPVACVALLPCLLVLRPWLHCPAWFVAVTSAPALAAVVVAAASPFGDAGPISVSRWGYFAGVALATAAFARTRDRRAAVVVLVLLIALHQYTEAWLAWWGGDDGVSRSMTGTIYSANPFGGMMLAFALMAGGLAVLAERPLRRLGWVFAPLASTAVFLSAARAAILLLVVGVLALAVLGARTAGLRGAARAAGVAGLSWLVLSLSSSTLFFAVPASGGSLEGVASKAESGQTLESTSGLRVDFWSAAVQQFVDAPVVGGGIGSYVGDSRMRMAPAAQRSQFAHNEVLGSFAEGGAVLGAPVLLAVGAGVVLFARPLLTTLRRGRRGTDAVACAVGLGGGALIAHSMLDFPLSFPAVLGLLALLLGCVAPVAAPSRGATAARRVLVSVAALVAVGSCGVYVGWSHDRVGVSGRAAPWAVDEAGRVLTPPLPGLRDGRVDVLLARRLVSAPDATPSQLAEADRRLQRLTPHDVSLRGERSALLAKQGLRIEALEEARGLARDAHLQAPLMLVPLAERLAEAGRADEAFDLLAREAYLRADERGRVVRHLVTALEQAHRLAPPTVPGWRCARDAMLAAGALARDHPLMGTVVSPAPAATCQAWAARTTALVGDTA